MHENDAARLRKRRRQAKEEGKKAISLFLTDNHKNLLDTFCRDLNISQPEAIGYLLECAYDRELPDLKHTSDDMRDEN